MFGLSEVRLLIDLFSVFGALFAFWKGGAAERMAAAVVVANVVIGTIGKGLAPESEPLIRLCNDGLAALLLLGITLRYGALWMGGAMLFYAAQFSLHSFYLVTVRQPDYLYALINNINWTSVIWCLIIGTSVAWWRRGHEPELIEEPAL